jgi:hypothetical protein
MVLRLISLYKRLLIAIYFSHVNVGQRRSTEPILTSKLFRSGQSDFFLSELKVLISSIHQALRNIVGQLSCDGNRVIMLILSEIELFHRLVLDS